MMGTDVSGNRLERALLRSRDIQRLQDASRMFDQVVDEVDGRRMRIGEKWLADFASCNYLGFDLDPEIIEGIVPYLRAWGTHPSWSRTLASPVLYEQIEHEVADLLGADSVLALPTLSHIHHAVIPILASAGDVYMDARAHKTIYDGCQAARGDGATVRRFPHNDIEELGRLLRASTAPRKMICTDGVNSMTGNPLNLPAFADLARNHDALLYIDDAHGFGVIGENPDTAGATPYGLRGNAVVRHFAESYDNIVLTAGFSKAYSSLLAFVACPSEVKRLLKALATPYAYSGPVPVASLASVLLGLQANERKGEEARTRLWHSTRRVLDRIRELGGRTSNTSGFPIIMVPLANPEDVHAVDEVFFRHGVYVAVIPYPIVPRNEVGFRIQLTAANTDDQISALTGALEEVAERFGL